MTNSFNQTAQYLSEACSVFLWSIKEVGAGTKTGKNATASQLNLKQGVGKPGVEFCPKDEYHNLLKKQKDELGGWMKNTDEGKKCSSEHQQEWKKGKKAAKYGKKRNIPAKEFKGVKNNKRYKTKVEKIVANATKKKD